MGFQTVFPKLSVQAIFTARKAACNPGYLRRRGEHSLKGKIAVFAAACLAATLAALLASLHGEARAPGPVLRVYLCSAAQKPWMELVRLFEEKTGVRVDAVYGSSGYLLAQLEAVGGDVYAPASPYYVEKAAEKGLVDPSTVRRAALLYPVILVPRGNPAHVRGLADLARPGVRVGIGEPTRVAVGRYARKLLEASGLWSRVRENIVVYAKNVAELTNYVAVGAVDAAITWDVNHWWYPRRTEAVPIPEEAWRSLGPSYIPVAVAAHSRHPGLARRFVEFVTSSPEARRVWEKYHYHPAAGG